MTNNHQQQQPLGIGILLGFGGPFHDPGHSQHSLLSGALFLLAPLLATPEEIAILGGVGWGGVWWGGAC